MNQMKSLADRIFSISSDEDFNQCSLEVFRFQAENNPIYTQFLKNLSVNSQAISHWSQIPFLPIEFFKNHTVVSGKTETELVFTSSGTTGMVTSRHFVVDLALYEQSFLSAFERFYGSVSEYCVCALLPAYLERKGSSLVYMAEKLIEKSENPASGFYLYNHDELYTKLLNLIQNNVPTVLLGVSFALLDFAEKFELPANKLIIMDTGGMKGRRKELTREELHGFLTQRLGVSSIHSEYGMTELLSQAYSQGEGHYFTPPWMRIRLRDTYDPFSYVAPGQTGGINIVDLANLYSCSFIETQDLGKLNTDGSFEVLGRFDQSDIRGCNLMVN
jgi:phenylacetate-coenzyme A ligase PaaK-like adenylate-forming protein